MAVPDRRRPSRERERAAELRGRRRECDVLDRLLDAVRGGEGRALVVRGEPGVGKTALLEYLAEHARAAGWCASPGSSRRWSLPSPGCTSCARRCWTASSASQLRSGPRCGPRSASVPGRRRTASWSGWPPSSLLADAAEEHPLVCLVDDEQWLDQASAQVLGFVARRLEAESVGLVFAARVPGDELAGLPELVVEGLQEADARALLEAALPGPLDAQVRDRMMAEARGNPLALLELPRGLPPAELAGGFALPDAIPLSGRIEASFRRRLDALPADTRVLVQLAAADPVGDPVLVWRAAERLGIATEAATPAAEAGLLEFGARVLFRHPLVRSAAYRSASLQQRQECHRALAEVTDPALDPDRRAWHRAQAAPGPDEKVAEELERSAGRAQARGGLAAAAAFLERAALLTPSTVGVLGACSRPRGPSAPPAPSTPHLGCWSRSRPGPPDPLSDGGGGAPARADHVCAARRRRRGRQLLSAARHLEPLNASLASRDVPGGARGRDLGRRPGQPRRPKGGRRGRPRRAPCSRPAACG